MSVIHGLLLSVIAVMLTGCASSTVQLEDIALASGHAGSGAGGATQKGIAVLKVSLESRCPYGAIVIAQKTPKGYVTAKKVSTVSTFLIKREAAQASLKPGTYHIVSFGCQSGRYMVSIGRMRSEGNMFNRKQYYDKSFASFEVKSGEVINVGHLIFKPKEGTAGLLYGAIDYNVSDLPQKAKDQIRAKQPKLFARLTPRLMVKNTSEISPAFKKALCAASKAMKPKDAKAKRNFEKLCKSKT